MGCASSRQRRRCRHCHHEPYSPVPRSLSTHRQSYDRSEEKEARCYHVVSLRSSTLGSLKLDLKNSENRVHGGNNVVADVIAEEKGKSEKTEIEFPVEKIKAKVIEEMKIPEIEPKTPVRTPQGEPETINAWELMEGLEDSSPLRSTPNHTKSFSFETGLNTSSFKQKSISPQNPQISPAPMWHQMSVDDQNQSIPQEIEEIPKSNTAVADCKSEIEEISKSNTSITDCKAEIEEIPKSNTAITDSKSEKDRAIVYFTSLRGIRKTYEDCCQILVILKGLGIRIDKRDVSLHSGFKDELKELLKDDLNGGLALPKVFLGEKLIGGANEIRRLNEDGNLEKMFQGCEIVEECDGGAGTECKGCGDVRFVPCETCSGSCKVFHEGDEEEEGEFQRCLDCNENGLIRCPVCWD